MSRVFTAASSEWLDVAEAPVTTYPFSVSFFFRPTTVGAAQTMFWLGNTAVANDYFSVELDATDHLIIHARDGVGSNELTPTVATVTVNTWHHAMAIFESATSRRISLDGGVEASGTDNITPDNTNGLAFGRHSTSAPGSYYDGHLMWAAIWDVAFANGEYEILSERKCPLYFRRDNLVDFYLLINSEDVDVVNRRALTANNTPTTSTNNPSRTAGGMYEIPADYWVHSPDKTIHSPRAA